MDAPDKVIFFPFVRPYEILYRHKYVEYHELTAGGQI